MSFVQLAALLVGQLGLIARDPALGYRGAALVESLGLLGTILAKGEEARAELEALAAQVMQMVSEGREPTKAEYSVLREKSREAHEILNPPPPPEEPAADDDQ